jgi:hypothetical protein
MSLACLLLPNKPNIDTIPTSNRYSITREDWFIY